MNRIFNVLRTDERVKIKGILRGFFWYTVRHNGSHFLLSRLRLLLATRGQTHVNLTSSVYHKPASEASLWTINV
jgi:hypothetical protein